jgi:hypothetical protein
MTMNSSIQMLGKCSGKASQHVVAMPLSLGESNKRRRPAQQTVMKYIPAAV